MIGRRCGVRSRVVGIDPARMSVAVDVVDVDERSAMDSPGCGSLARSAPTRARTFRDPDRVTVSTRSTSVASDWRSNGCVRIVSLRTYNGFVNEQFPLLPTIIVGTTVIQLDFAIFRSFAVRYSVSNAEEGVVVAAPVRENRTLGSSATLACLRSQISRSSILERRADRDRVATEENREG